MVCSTEGVEASSSSGPLGGEGPALLEGRVFGVAALNVEARVELLLCSRLMSSPNSPRQTIHVSDMIKKCIQQHYENGMEFMIVVAVVYRKVECMSTQERVRSGRQMDGKYVTRRG